MSGLALLVLGGRTYLGAKLAQSLLNRITKVGFEGKPGEVDQVRAPGWKAKILAGAAPREIGREAMMVGSRLSAGGPK